MADLNGETSSTNPKPRGGHKHPILRLIFLLLVVVIITLIFSIKGTFDEVTRARWNEGKYAYSTFRETNKIILLNPIIERADKFSWFKDSWLEKRLWDIRASIYASAVKKIPADDGEQMLWFYMAKFAPYLKEKERGGQNDDYIFKAVLDQLLNEPNKKYASTVVRDVSRYIFLNQYILYLRDHNKFQSLPIPTRRAIYEAAFRQAEQIDIQRVLAYKEHGEYPTIYMTLFSSYFFLVGGLQSGIICDGQGVAWLNAVDKKIGQYLIQKPSLAFDAIRTRNVDKERFLNLESQYSSSKLRLSTRLEECASKN